MWGYHQPMHGIHSIRGLSCRCLRLPRQSALPRGHPLSDLSKPRFLLRVVSTGRTDQGTRAGLPRTAIRDPQASSPPQWTKRAGLVAAVLSWGRWEDASSSGPMAH